MDVTEFKNSLAEINDILYDEEGYKKEFDDYRDECSAYEEAYDTLENLCWKLIDTLKELEK